jgi:polyribonucleotide nucleotidyltransferase
MALMAAGVPLKEAVAGIGVGLITKDGNEDDYKLLLDIEGIEDFYGDMDFKVTGTKNGITAIQFENKLRGVKLEVLKKAFRLAQTGRMQVLQVMNLAIAETRGQLAANAPVVGKVKIAQDKIGMLIGPGGKTIKDLTARSEAYGKSSADINIDDDGTVLITASNAAQLDFIKNEIDSMLGDPEVGKIYKAKVDRVMPYGIFVNVSSNISGLCHVSEIFDKRGEYNLDNIFKKDDELKVTITKIDGDRLNFSIKGLEQDADIARKIAEAQGK